MGPNFVVLQINGEPWTLGGLMLAAATVLFAVMTARTARYLTWVFGSALLCQACHSDKVVANAASADAGSVHPASAGASGRSSAPAAGGSSGSVSSGGNGLPRLRCTESEPTTGVHCADQLCASPSASDAQQCIMPCCVTVNGVERCGTRSTGAGFSSGCALPGAPDPTCDDVPQFPGCCDPQHKCGVLLPLQSGCVTQTNFVTLPQQPKSCGLEDAGA